jgi:hypothetical protein
VGGHDAKPDAVRVPADGVGAMMRAAQAKIEWLAYAPANAPAAVITLGGEPIGRVYHEGISWTIVVRGVRRGGYASVAQMARDARWLWLKGASA